LDGHTGIFIKASKPVIITRKIQILLQAENKEQLKENYEKLRKWQQIVAKAANWIATHHYVQENMKDLFYLTDEARIKLTDVKKDEAGILTTSRMSTTYRLLSGKFKGQIPMAIISSLNNRIISVFDKEKKEYQEGTRSLRSYKQDLPVPIAASDIIHITAAGTGEYVFILYGLSFRTNFGRDASGNREVFEKSLRGEYKLCDSSIAIKKNKLFLLAVFSFDRTPARLSDDIRVEAWLSVDIPIVAAMGETRIRIGSREEYLHRRLAIQDSMRRAQAAVRFNRGGKGRKKKMQALERFRQLEKNYVTTRLHQYSARLIDFCLKHGAGVLVLRSQLEKEAVAAENEFLLRNWTYYGLKEKIRYKADQYGINVIVE
jgi:IS605 OrfB family transposase